MTVVSETNSIAQAWLRELHNIRSRNIRGICTPAETLYALQHLATDAGVAIPMHILREHNTMNLGKAIQLALEHGQFGVATENEFLCDGEVRNAPTEVWCALIEAPNATFAFHGRTWSKRAVGVAA